jgi:hypothetical protein
MKKQGNPLQRVLSNHHLKVQQFSGHCGSRDTALEVLREKLIKVYPHPELALLISVHLISLKFEV